MILNFIRGPTAWNTHNYRRKSLLYSQLLLHRDSVKHHARQTHGGGQRGYEPKIKFANNAMYTSHWNRRELYRSLVYGICMYKFSRKIES